MTERRLIYEMHSHTPLCRHASGLPGEYAAVAWQRGLRGLAVTCHNPMPPGFSEGVRMKPEEMPQYIEMVDEARREWAGKVDVLLGLECDYFPGTEGYVERQLENLPLHHVLGSVHAHLSEYHQAYWRDDPIAFQETYFEHLAAAAETRLFDTLAHPDLVKNCTAEHWHPERIIDAIRRCLDRVAKAGVAMELNTSGIGKRVPEMNPHPLILREMQRREIPVVLGADAHKPETVSNQFEQALDLAEAAGYSRISYFIARRRHDIPIDEARRSLKPL